MSKVIYVAAIGVLLLDLGVNRKREDRVFVFEKSSGAEIIDVMKWGQGGCERTEFSEDDRVVELSVGQELEFDYETTEDEALKFAVEAGFLIEKSEIVMPVEDKEMSTEFVIDKEYEPVLEPLVDFIVAWILKHEWVREHDMVGMVIRLFASKNFFLEYEQKIKTEVEARLS